MGESPFSTCCNGWRHGSTRSERLQGALPRSLIPRSFALPLSSRLTLSLIHFGESTLRRCAEFASAATLAGGHFCPLVRSETVQNLGEEQNGHIIEMSIPLCSSPPGRASTPQVLDGLYAPRLHIDKHLERPVEYRQEGRRHSEPGRVILD
jgi:hypothetical protein